MPAKLLLNLLTELKKYFIPIFLFTLFISSCKKEEVTLLTQEVDGHTTHQLHDVLFVNDSVGYICGGEKWDIGIFMRTTDGGKTWSVPDSIFNACAYSMQFFSPEHGIVSGNVSDWAYTVDSGKTFSASQSDYVAINQFAFINQQVGVRVGGDGYATGYITSTQNGGNTWNKITLPNNMMAVRYTDSNTVFASGYGVIYKSTDAGVTFNPLDVRGDFFMAMDFPTPQVGYFAGYEGLILKTTDGGNSFKRIRRGNEPFGHRVHWETIKFWNENIGYVAGDNGELLKTENGGDDWKTVKSFTSANLRDIHFFSAASGIIVGDNGKIFLFTQ